MLDKIDYRIARNLAENHHYPYAREIYINIFKNFSHFPLKLQDLGIQDQGTTITYMALVIWRCFDHGKTDFSKFYKKILQELKESPVSKMRYNLAVETYLGCVLYYYHPVNIKNILSTMEVDDIFNDKERYEYEIKKKTVLLYTI
ncbi:MAG: hypothetical protein KAV45_08775 [Calditrichia bacterium]|nr:hypothetical protein [Calditrichia bacterium]